MRRERHLGQRAKIVDPVEVLLVGGDVEPADEQVDRIRLPRAQALRERSPDPRGGGEGPEGVRVADLVQAEVAFDVFRELNRVTW